MAAWWSRWATIGDVPAIREFLADACADLGAAEELGFRCQLAAGELCANVLRHGYGGGPGPLEVRIRRTGTGVSLTVRDEAFAFDPTVVRAAPVGSPIGDREPGGLGLLLVRELVDGMEHTAVRGGNEVALTIEDPGSPTDRTPP